jgi:hypothetical protein
MERRRKKRKMIGLPKAGGLVILLSRFSAGAPGHLRVGFVAVCLFGATVVGLIGLAFTAGNSISKVSQQRIVLHRRPMQSHRRWVSFKLGLSPRTTIGNHLASQPRSIIAAQRATHRRRPLSFWINCAPSTGSSSRKSSPWRTESLAIP